MRFRNDAVYREMRLELKNRRIKNHEEICACFSLLRDFARCEYHRAYAFYLSSLVTLCRSQERTVCSQDLGVVVI